MAKAELLAPAGDWASLQAAARFGADAVYIGGPQLQLRAASAGFAAADIGKAAAYLHGLGKKLYVTVNCFVKDAETDGLGAYARQLHALGADAAIVADLGALAAMKEGCPELALHVSTQANCQNARCAEVYRKLGASRIVLAREMTIGEIAELHRRLPAMELEAFVHGAMCMAYSGRCLLSSFLAGRSGNRGDCAQPCRWQYHLTERQRPGEYFQLEESPNGLAILSSGDLDCLSFLDELTAAGVCSLKIEGRMKSPYYVATVTNAYRMRLDGAADSAALEAELRCVSHRPYTSGFYYGPPAPPPPDEGVYLHDCLYAADVAAAPQDGRLKIVQRNVFCEGDELEVLRPGALGLRFRVGFIENAAGERLTRANHAKETLWIGCPLPLEPGDMLRLREAKEEMPV